MADEDTCTLCGGELKEAEIEEEKLERLKNGNKHLKGENIHKLVCKNCGHTAYVIKNSA